MAEGELDVLVIGGGITGTGVALDAASRGMTVGLVERDDFASGTSGRSSRMIHGGIRYLAQHQYGVVLESLRERAVLRRLAPHLARPVPMYVPTPDARSRLELRLGLYVYDALAFGRNVGRDAAVSAEELHRAIPGFDHPTAGLKYFECRTDDARLTLEVARTARSFGAWVANHAAVDALTGEGRVTGAVVTDVLSGERFDVRARAVVNAAGVWADRVQAMASQSPRRLRPSKGVHLVFAPGAVRTHAAMTLRSGAGDGRYVFVVPWEDRVYAGTTDTNYEGDLDHPTVTAEDRDYLLAGVRQAFPLVTADDVVASWAGLRPLLGDRDGPTADLSRRHAIYESPPGLFTITGGKLTAYRAMAEEMMDRVGRSLGVRRGSRTRHISLGLSAPLDEALHGAVAAAEPLHLDEAIARRMVYRFGDDWRAALDLLRDDPSLASPAVAGLPVVKAELVLARAREMAMTAEDVAVRRTRLTTLDERARLRSDRGASGSSI